MSLITAPDPPISEKPVVMRLTLQDRNGKPISGAQITAALEMPLMEMGANQVIFTNTGSGNYETTSKFTMTGPWNLAVTAHVRDQSERQVFPIAVRE
ncbi:MAG: FixH family protein [Terriglobales bacterium]|jgi:nitrogen fixation protein FixH